MGSTTSQQIHKVHLDSWALLMVNFYKLLVIHSFKTIKFGSTKALSAQKKWRANNICLIWNLFWANKFMSGDFMSFKPIRLCTDQKIQNWTHFHKGSASYLSHNHQTDAEERKWTFHQTIFFFSFSFSFYVIAVTWFSSTMILSPTKDLLV